MNALINYYARLTAAHLTILTAVAVCVGLAL